MPREGFVVYHELMDFLTPYGDAERGRILTAMLTYSMTGEAPGLSGNERFIWPAIKAKIDRDRRAYESACRRNRSNAERRYERAPETADACGRIPEGAETGGGAPDAPTETETGTETGTKTGAGKKDRAPARARGQYGWVKLTDEQYEKLVRDLGKEEAERCIAYVDESAQSTGNKNRWKDWNLTVRKCHRDGWGLRPNGQRMSKTDEYINMGRDHRRTPEEMKSLLSGLDRI